MAPGCGGESARIVSAAGAGVAAGSGGTSAGKGSTDGGGGSEAGAGSSGKGALGGDAGAMGARGGANGTGGSGGKASGGAGVGGGGASGEAGEVGQAGQAGAMPWPPVECTGSVALTTTTSRCDNGLIHRPAALACPTPVRDEELGLAGNAGLDDQDCGDGPSCRLTRDDCTRDADCGAGLYCIRTTRQSGDADFVYEHLCVGCSTDIDCAAGEICACEIHQRNAPRTQVELGVCRPSTCTADSECEPGYYCMAAPIIDTDRRRTPFQHWEFHCQSPRDQCALGGDCPSWVPITDCDEPAAVCRYSTDAERWQCGFESPGGWDDSC